MHRLVEPLETDLLRSTFGVQDRRIDVFFVRSQEGMDVRQVDIGRALP
jgi:hypothetical protein